MLKNSITPMLTLILFTFGCVSNSITSKSIIGIWKYTELRDSSGNILENDIMDFNMHINPDSTFKLTNGYWLVEGQWILKDNVLVLDGQEQFPGKKKTVQKKHIKELTEDAMITRLNIEGKTNCGMVYKRIR